MTIEAILQWFALFGGITGLGTFIFKVRSEISNARVERDAMRAAEVETWREVAAYRFFGSVGRAISREDLLTALRNASFEDEAIDIRKDDLSNDAVERLIISMVSKDLIEPFDGDTFILRIMPLEKLQERGFVSPFETQHSFLLNKVRTSPGEYTEITLRENSDFAGRPVHFRYILRELLESSLVHFGPNGKLFPIHEDSWADAIYSSSLTDDDEKSPSVEET